MLWSQKYNTDRFKMYNKDQKLYLLHPQLLSSSFVHITIQVQKVKLIIGMISFYFNSTFLKEVMIFCEYLYTKYGNCAPLALAFCETTRKSVVKNWV